MLLSPLLSLKTLKDTYYSAAVKVRGPANKKSEKGSACRLHLLNESIMPNYLAETGNSSLCL